MSTSIRSIEIEGLVTIHLKDRTTIQTTRNLHLEVDVNGPGSSQASSHLCVEQFNDEANPYGLIDSDHPLVRQFVERFLEIIAAPGVGHFDVLARSESTAPH